MKLEEKLGKGGDTAKKQEKGETRRKNGKKGRHSEKSGKGGDTVKKGIYRFLEKKLITSSK